MDLTSLFFSKRVVMDKQCEECNVTIPDEDDLCPKCWDEWDGLTIEEILENFPN